MAGNHFSTIGDRRSKTFDKFLELRSYSAAPVAATTSEAPILFPARKTGYVKARILHQAITGFVAGTAQWTLTIEAGATSGGTFTPIRTITLAGTKADFEAAIAGIEVSQRVPNAEFLRVTATLTGAAGPLTYGVHLVNV